MTWCSMKEKHIKPDFDMVDRVLEKLNGVFDAYDLYHHSCPRNIFEFTYQKDDYRRETWQITFMGKPVTSGGGSGLDYDDFYEDDYLFLIPENAETIYNQAYNGAINYITDILNYVAIAEIPKECKQGWISVINNGIDRIEKDMQKENQYWYSTKDLS